MSLLLPRPVAVSMALKAPSFRLLGSALWNDCSHAWAGVGGLSSCPLFSSQKIGKGRIRVPGLSSYNVSKTDSTLNSLSFPHAQAVHWSRRETLGLLQRMGWSNRKHSSEPTVIYVATESQIGMWTGHIVFFLEHCVIKAIFLQLEKKWAKDQLPEIADGRGTFS